MKYVIGNWKANKNLVETGLWLTTFLNFDFSRIQNRVTLILCPPYPLIPLVKEKLSGLPFVKIGCQNISFYNPGAYTGEVPARSIVGLVDYCIVGHSERRQYFSENHDYLAVKVKHLQSVNIETTPHPGFMTDWQPNWAVLMTQAQGKSTVNERVFENRFSYVSELKKLGAKIRFLEKKVENPKDFYYFNYVRGKKYNQVIEIDGPVSLHGGALNIADLRAGASLATAALVADGESVVNGVSILERGYEDFVEKVRNLGGEIKKI